MKNDLGKRAALVKQERQPRGEIVIGHGNLARKVLLSAGLMPMVRESPQSCSKRSLTTKKPIRRSRLDVPVFAAYQGECSRPDKALKLTVPEVASRHAEGWFHGTQTAG